MQIDIIEKFHNSTIHHGKLSDRVYLMKAATQDIPVLPTELKNLAQDKGYTKIFAKVPISQVAGFLEAGYLQEALIPGFYKGSEDAVFLGFFLDQQRGSSDQAGELEKILQCARDRAGDGLNQSAGEAVIRPCTPEDVQDMAAIYTEVFPSYPYPIDRPDYLLETMESHVAYFGAELDGKLAALASSEMDKQSLSVEMTDFATLPICRGKSLSAQLLTVMEKDMAVRGFLTAYTIARAISPGMNITFAKLNYTYGGRLINNTGISGQIESMNVWYKSLRA